MPDLVNSAAKATDHNRYTIAASIVALALFAVTGCGLLDGKGRDPTTGELASADVIYANVLAKVSEFNGQIAQLQNQRDTLVETANIEIDFANAETESNYALLNAVIDSPLTQSLLASTGIGGFLVGGAALLDNRRKDKVIKKVS